MEEAEEGEGWDALEPLLWGVTAIDKRLSSLARSLDQLYADRLIDGKKLSERQRNEEQRTQIEAGLQLSNFAYGEILFDTFFELVGSKISKHWRSGQDKTFIDLGSGTGKVVLAIKMGFPEGCVGTDPRQRVSSQITTTRTRPLRNRAARPAVVASPV